MKTSLHIRWITGLMMGIFSLSLLASTPSKAEVHYGVSFQVFYDELMPYGDWVRDARYGFIWLPAVGPDFHPYATNGHWAMTEFGNTWVSYYDWGWAPFHYGRWYYDDFYQSWAWIPGYDWGPAWVSWRTGGGYYGWAPLGPRISISVRIGIPSLHWVFLPQGRIYDRYAWRYYAPHRTKIKIINRTTVINNTIVYNNNTYIAGPSSREIRRVTGRNVPVYRLENSTRPGRVAVSNNRVSMYRPDLQSSRSRKAEARPSRVLESNEARNRRSESATSPSRTRSLENTSSNRSASPSVRSNSRVDRSSPSSSRGTGTSGRQVSPRSSQSKTFETRPYEAPKQNNRSGRVEQSSRNREGSVRSSSPSRSNGSSSGRVQEPSRSSTVKKGSTQSRGRSVQSSPSRSNTRVQAPSKSKSRAQAPSRSSSRVQSSSKSNSRVATPSRSSSSQKSSSRSSSSSRGNSRNN
ncbi:MAG: hypothetical protein HWE15_00260 [Algoriphagus sp.]|uniref:DUF6600 domain-containing protein n=1 Tax=Algoriphagus sp. TaxID=1872435 RepID=UPI00183E3BA4|nr:DUF6600 domain-containing protein [Algoriphagus sp.]NVJ84705.1 hypothetical protein [Algoriphagus sp.]